MAHGSQDYDPSSPPFCQDGNSIPWQLQGLKLSLPTSRFTSCRFDQDRAFGGLSCSSFFLEPTSVLDGHLSSHSPDSMHSPLSACTDQQQVYGNDQCLQELEEGAVCVPVTSAPVHCRVLPGTEEMREMRSENAAVGDGEQGLLEQRELEMAMAMGVGDFSSDWIDCLVNDLQEEAREVEIASCFDQTNPCESAHSSLEEESWSTEDFAFACSSSSQARPYPAAVSPDLHASSSSSSSRDDDHLFACNNFTGAAHAQTALAHQQQERDPLQLPLVLPYNLPPHENTGSINSYQRTSDAVHILSCMGLLGFHLQRKCSDQGIILLQTLIDFVKTVTRSTESSSGSRRKSPTCSNAAIKPLLHMSSDYGDPLQRLCFYFTEAISINLQYSINPSPTKGLFCCPEDEVRAYQTFNETCPYIKFAHLTANQAILEAATVAEKVHIIDCGIVQGVQWAALLQAFATRPADAIPRKIRITGIASPNLCSDPCASLAATGKRLTEFAMLLHLNLEFCPVCSNLEDLDLPMLRLESDEFLAVNFMFQLHHLLAHDSLRHLQRALNLLHLLNPAVITIAEYEASINTPSLHARFLSSFCFYASIFDSLDAALARDDPDRIKVEKLFFGTEIRKLMRLDQEAADRRESSDNWRRLLEKSGFWMKPLSWYATNQARLLLWLYCDRFSLTEVGPGCLSLGWLHHPIITVSAWQC